MRNRVTGQAARAIADGHIPAWSNGPQPETIGHESVSMLNTGEVWAHIEMQTPLSERDPVGPYRMTIAPRRTCHGRCNDLRNPQPIPKGVDYSISIRADAPAPTPDGGLLVPNLSRPGPGVEVKETDARAYIVS